MAQLMTQQEIAVNFGEIWALFRETDQIIKQTNLELSERFKKTDERFKKTDEIIKQTNIELSERFKKTDERIKRTEKMVGKLGGRWGEFVEGLVVPAVVDLFRQKGIDIERVAQRVVSRKEGKTMEIDILGENGNDIVVVEVKSRLTNEEVRSFINTMKQFKFFFPAHADKKIIGAVASIVMREDVARFAYKQGLFIIGQKGDTVKILNDAKFIYKTW